MPGDVKDVKHKLPRRVVPRPLRYAGQLLTVLGAIFLLAAARSFPNAWAWLGMIGLLPLNFGLLLLTGHAEFKLRGACLIAEERGVCCYYRRIFALNDLGDLRTGELSLSPVYTVSYLAAHLPGRGPRVITFGYAQSVLANLAREIEVWRSSNSSAV